MKLICTILIITGAGLLGCKKDFLDTKPDDSLVVPATISELQALLDEDRFMNGSSKAGFRGPNPQLGEIGSDDYYLTDADYAARSPYMQNAYRWAKEVYEGATVQDWNMCYKAIFYANIALDNIDKITPNAGEQAAWNNVKGSALFYRAHTFYQLAQVFAPPYTGTGMDSKWGIPLRLVSDISEKTTRSSQQATYQQIISDLKQALPLLPAVPLYKTRPSQPAVLALLARVFLTMQDYSQSLTYATSCIKQSNGLYNYNKIAGSTANYPFPGISNPEIIFHCVMQNDPSEVLTNSRARVDSQLYSMYENQDLRRTLYYKDGGAKGGKAYYGSYDASTYLFTGITTSEQYLIQAECYARDNQTQTCLDTLNAFLKNRYRDGYFVPATAVDAEEALRLVLKERRKELVFRGLRWEDLRRLNQDKQFEVTIQRLIAGVWHELLPGSNKYTWPIPDIVIGFTGIPQNDRQ